MSSPEIFSGTVSRVLFENDDFRILLVNLDSDKGASGLSAAVTVKGDFPAQNVQIGTWVSFEGKWIEHEQYGKQISVTRSPVAVSKWTNDRVAAALSSNGVGPTTRAQLLAHAKSRGIPLSDLLDQTAILIIPGLDQVTLDHALSRWRSLRTYMDAATFMSEAGLPASIVSAVWKTFGTDLEKLVTVDPWVLVQIPGITFQEVDEIAVRLNVPLSNPGRVRGAVLASIQEAIRDGHVFSTTGQVVAAVSNMIPGVVVPPAEVAAAISDLLKATKIVVDKATQPGLVALYDSWHYRVEVECALLLWQRLTQPLEESYLKVALCRVGDKVRDAFDQGASLEALAIAALENWSAGHKTALTPEQLQSATQALVSPVSLLTGLPGTGKTTTLRAVVSILRDMGIPFLLAAPTGIAAKRMSSVTGAEAATIHRAFGAKGFMKDGEEREASYVGVTGDKARKTSSGGDGEWEYGEGNHHPAKCIVVDESSMLDLHMLYRLLTATSPTCRLMFVGDPFQLPSVGSGDVLHDLVKSGIFPHSHLTTIFRQEETSGIVLAAHAVHAGKLPSTAGKDFVLLEAATEEEASDLITMVSKKLYDKRMNFQVLSPRHAGSAGVTALNSRLRLALNPAGAGVAEMRLGGSVVREGDRIMIVKNDYNLGVYNGDVGKVSTIDRRSKEVELKIFAGPGQPARIVSYQFKDATRAIRLAYAQTVHKSQGQEYDVIVLPVLPSFGQQLQRNLFYTAITRAKKRVFLIGVSSAILKAVENNQAESRNSLLGKRLVALHAKGASTCAAPVLEATSES